MEIGQPKLSERKSLRNGLFVPPTSPYSNMLIAVDDYQWKEWRRKQAYEAAFDAKDLLQSTQCTQKLYPIRASPSGAGIPA